jgi:urease accessory protein
MSTPLQVFERLGTACSRPADSHVVLSHDQRDRGRLRAETSDGVEVRIFLERGSPLVVGEMLRTECGKHLVVEGAYEDVATASCEDWTTFSRACYHLGNRHVKMQVGERWLRILPDHVLEDLLRKLGLTVMHESGIFVPEQGAYGNGGHQH